MVKKTKTANDKSRLSSPSRPLKRPRPTENASQGSVRAEASTSSIPSRKSDSSNLTPTRSSTRKYRSTAKAAAMEDSSDSDCTPPPSIFSRSPVKKRIPEKRVSRNETEVPEPGVIDLTVPQTSSPKSPKKRPKIDRHLPVNLDSFINLCSDEEMIPQPRKKRKVLPAADEVIFISSGDEAEFVQRTLEHAAEVPVSNKEYVAGYPAASTDPDTSHGMETCHNHPDVPTPRPTPPPASPLENDSPGSVTVDTASQNMAGIEELSTPRSSRKPLNGLYQDSLQNPPVNSFMSEESRSTSFCNTPGPEPKQQIHKAVSRQAKRALLTSLIFARPMRSLGRTDRPRANVILPRTNSLKPVALIDSSIEGTTPLHQDDAVSLDFPKFVPDTTPSSTISPPSFTNTADTGPVNAGTFLGATTCGDIPSASPLMEVDETEVEVEPGFSAADDHSNVVPSSCTVAKDVPSPEIVLGEDAMMVAHDSPEADDHHAEGGFTEADPNQNIGSANPTTPDIFPATTTCEDMRVSSASPLMGVERVFSAQFKATVSDDAIPASCTGESPRNLPSMEVIVGENVMMEADDTSSPREGQVDDHLADGGFAEPEPNQNIGPANPTTPDIFPATTTCEDMRVSSASPLMGVERVFSAQFKATDDAIPASCTGESPRNLPSMEIIVGENVMMEADGTSTPREGQVDGHLADGGFAEPEPNQNIGPANPTTLDIFLATTTCEDMRVSSASPLMGVERVFSAQLKATVSDDAIPASCTGESPRNLPSMEVIVGENVMMEADDTSSPREGQVDDHIVHGGFTEPEPMQNSEKQLPSAVAECVLRISAEVEDTCVTSDTHHETPSRSAVHADEPLIHPTHIPSRHPSCELILDSNCPDEPLGNSSPPPFLQTYINSSIFELEHSPNLSFQILFTSNKILDDVTDLAISLPCYPEQLRY